jgi:hypothetical protein
VQDFLPVPLVKAMIDRQCFLQEAFEVDLLFMLVEPPLIVCTQRNTIDGRMQ